MIELDKPLDEREPIEIVEMNYYRLRLSDDSIVRAMEKIQAAAVSMVALEEVQPGPGSLHAKAASNSLMHAHRLLALEREQIQHALKGIASYLTLYEVELFDSMQDLVIGQQFLKEELVQES